MLTPFQQPLVKLIKLILEYLGNRRDLSTECSPAALHHINDGVEHAKNGRYEEAIVCFLEAGRIDKQYVGVELRIMKAKIAQGNFKEVLTFGGVVFEKTKNPKAHAQAHDFIGIANKYLYDKSQDPRYLEAAINAFRKARQTDSSNLLAIWNEQEATFLSHLRGDEHSAKHLKNARNLALDLEKGFLAGGKDVLIYGTQILEKARRIVQKIHRDQSDHFWPQHLYRLEESINKARAKALQPEIKPGKKSESRVRNIAISLVAAFLLSIAGYGFSSAIKAADVKNKPDIEVPATPKANQPVETTQNPQPAEPQGDKEKEDEKAATENTIKLHYDSKTDKFGMLIERDWVDLVCIERDWGDLI